jgi:hypothetical protein
METQSVLRCYYLQKHMLEKLVGYVLFPQVWPCFELLQFQGTPLHAAVVRGHVGCIQLLLEAGADTKATRMTVSITMV